MNNTVSNSTGQTPAKLLFGVNQNGNIPDVIRSYLVDHKLEDLTEMRLKPSEKINKNQMYDKSRFDKRHKVPVKYKVGDKVVITNTVTVSTAGVNKKLLPKFKGPYEVEKVLPNDRYLLKNVDDCQITQLPFYGVCAV